MPTSSALLCLVVAITDGDTLRARCTMDGSPRQVVIRLAEIDAPESGQAWGQRSKRSLDALCHGQDATIRPSTQDRYHRTVARVTCRGKDASAHQVEVGMAWAFTRYMTDPSIKALETDARTRGVGLWADASPIPPWEFRRR